MLRAAGARISAVRSDNRASVTVTDAVLPSRSAEFKHRKGFSRPGKCFDKFALPWGRRGFHTFPVAGSEAFAPGSTYGAVSQQHGELSVFENFDCVASVSTADTS